MNEGGNGDGLTLAGQFERQRGRLRAVAFRMLGSRGEADDAVQEAWLRLGRVDSDGIENLRGWLTTVVGRVCLDMLRTRKTRGEHPLDGDVSELPSPADAADPEHAALLADSMSLALLTVLDALTPAERVAFVLHDMFDLSFDEIAPIVGKSPVAARQLASRARRRVRGQPVPHDAAPERRREVVRAFFAASRGGDFAALLALLDPAVVLTADRVAVAGSLARRAQGAPALSAEMPGPDAVATVFSGRAAAARLALIDGAPGAVVRIGGELRVVFLFTVEEELVRAIEIVADPDRLRTLDIVTLE